MNSAKALKLSISFFVILNFFLHQLYIELFNILGSLPHWVFVQQKLKKQQLLVSSRCCTVVIINNTAFCLMGIIQEIPSLEMWSLKNIIYKPQLQKGTALKRYGIVVVWNYGPAAGHSIWPSTMVHRSLSQFHSSPWRELHSSCDGPAWKLPDFSGDRWIENNLWLLGVLCMLYVNALYAAYRHNRALVVKRYLT